MADALAPLALEPGVNPGGWVLHVYSGRPGHGGHLVMVSAIGPEPSAVETQALADAERALELVGPGEELAALFYDGDTGELAGLYRLPSLVDLESEGWAG